MQYYVNLIFFLISNICLSQQFNNKISIDKISNFFSENTITTEKEWGFTFVHNDSTFLKTAMQKLIASQVAKDSISNIYSTLEDDDPLDKGYAGYPAIDVYKQKQFSPTSLYETYNDYLHLAEKFDISLIGYEVISSEPRKEIVVKKKRS